MRKRAFLGGVAVLAVVLTTFFTGIIPGFGTGSGTGDATTTPPVQAETTTQTTPENQPADTKPDPAKPVPPEPEAPPVQLVQVVVDGDKYGLQIPDGRYQVVPISEILAAAKKATGNEDGIKVRILRKPTAKVVAWSTLHEELEKSGIASSAILIPKKLVD